MLQVNEYFDGKVKSIAFQGDHLPSTVDVMEPGEYEFSTEKKEHVTVISGCLVVRLPGDNEWIPYPAETDFFVAANEKFQLQVQRQTAYLCTYE